MKVFVDGDVKKSEKKNQLLKYSKKKTKIELKLHKHKIPAVIIDISHLSKNHIKAKIMGNFGVPVVKTNKKW